MSTDKKYGLILPSQTKSKQLVFQASRNVFGNDSDSDDGMKKKPVLTKSNDTSNRKTKIAQEKAVLDDPTVYQYDEIYDSMTSKEEKVKTKEEKKPRYIENLMKAANKRKIENERRVERQVQKERIKEGDEFADKEVFVTSAYKKKLQEMRLEEEKEKREEYLESIGDVTKQKDLGGFYRHLYEQKLGKVDKEKTIDTEISEHKSDTKECDTKDKSNKVESDPSNKTETLKKRNYRKRKSSDNAKQLSDGEIEDSDEEINRVNLNDIREAKKSKNLDNIDADSDFNDESSDEDSGKETNNKQPITESTSETPPKSESETVTKKLVKDESRTEDNDEKDTQIEPPKQKIDIWKKRTVGEVFDQAVLRYYQRKAARGI